MSWLKRNYNFTIFFSLLIILIADRVNTLINFCFLYTDIDQVVLWNGAVDYSKGIFHEPFFYGQSYNYMIEALVAVPLLWSSIPVTKSLPIATTIITCTSFISLAYLFYRNKNYFFSQITLAFPVLLTIEYNILTSIPRGFNQAMLASPLLFASLFDSNKKRSMILFYTGAGLSFILNQSAVLIIIPIGAYHFWKEIKNKWFYINAVILIPFYLLDKAAKHYYVIYPEKDLHKISGTEFDFNTLVNSLLHFNHWEYLFLFKTNLGTQYIYLISGLIIINLIKRNWRSFIFTISALTILIVSLGIPKTQVVYEGAGVFFTPNRLYILLPLIFILSLYVTFENIKVKKALYPILLCLSLFFVIHKHYRFEESITEIIGNTKFPVAFNENITERITKLYMLQELNEPDQIININNRGWSYAFDSYCYYPVVSSILNKNKIATCTNLNSDRRTWLYDSSLKHKKLILNGIKSHEKNDNNLALKDIDHDKVFIENNSLPLDSLMNTFGLYYGIKGI